MARPEESSLVFNYFHHVPFPETVLIVSRTSSAGGYYTWSHFVYGHVILGVS